MTSESLKNMLFKTCHFSLRTVSSSDESFFVYLLTDTMTMRCIEEPLSQRGAIERFNKELSSLNQPLPSSLLWVITRKSDNSKIGLIGISQRKIFENGWELGVILSKDCVNQGIAKEVIEGLVNKILVKIGIDKLYGRIKHNNLISIAMVTSFGFKNYKNDDDYSYWILTKK